MTQSTKVKRINKSNVLREIIKDIPGKFTSNDLKTMVDAKCLNFVITKKNIADYLWRAVQDNKIRIIDKHKIDYGIANYRRIKDFDIDSKDNRFMLANNAINKVESVQKIAQGSYLKDIINKFDDCFTIDNIKELLDKEYPNHKISKDSLIIWIAYFVKRGFVDRIQGHRLNYIDTSYEKTELFDVKGKIMKENSKKEIASVVKVEKPVISSIENKDLVEQAAANTFVDKKDPVNWKPTVRPAKINTKLTKQNNLKNFPLIEYKHEENVQVVKNVSQSSGLIDYPFPIRDNLVARLLLPRDISSLEAKRLYGFMMALTADSVKTE